MPVYFARGGGGGEGWEEGVLHFTPFRSFPATLQPLDLLIFAGPIILRTGVTGVTLRAAGALLKV